MLCSSPSANTADFVSPVITLHRVTKRFQSTAALSQISVTIPPGQFVAIIGRSGAGKTTLLHCLSRGTVVTEGVARFGVCDLTTLHGEMLPGISWSGASSFPMALDAPMPHARTGSSI